MKDEFGINKINFATEDDTYIETLVIENKMINVYASDSGQCFWFQWMDEYGEIQSMSCGTYCFDYKSMIEEYFKPDNQRLLDQVRNLRDGLINTNRDIAYLIKILKEHFPNENFERPEGEL